MFSFISSSIAFYLHHSNIDRIWWKWQRQSHDHLWDYGGKSCHIPKWVNLSDHIPFFTDTLVKDVMEIGVNDMCYEFNETINSESVERIMALPQHFVRQYFPKFYAGNYSDCDYDLPAPRAKRNVRFP